MSEDKPSLKEAYRMFYMVKGHLDITDEHAYSSYNSYFRRLWRDGSDGAPLYNYDSDFQVAWAKDPRSKKSEKK
tara:strand:- start:37 stop:258 length:222 start_codon:yes stop_codon:yes gene_type:complete